MAITFTAHYNGFNFSLDGKAVAITEIIAKGIKPTVEETGVILGQIQSAYPVGNEYREWATGFLNRLQAGV